MIQKSNDTGFIQEYLYIEEYPFDIMSKEYISSIKKKNDEPKRGIVVIDLHGTEEEI